MTSTTEKKPPKIIHIARIQGKTPPRALTTSGSFRTAARHPSAESDASRPTETLSNEVIKSIGHYLFLKQLDLHTYTWFDDEDNATAVSATTIEEAIRLARRTWKERGFRTVICGFRYTLPERDEHGSNAFFFQMAASLSSMNGVYFDEELGHNCLVQGASSEAKELWQKFRDRR